MARSGTRHAEARRYVELTPLRGNAAARLLPAGGVVGGWAAACLLGAAEIDGLADDGSTSLPVLLYPGQRMRLRPGLELSRSRLGAGDILDAGGVPPTSPVRTVFDLGRRAGDQRGAVVAPEQALRCLDVGLHDLREYAPARPRWQGAPLLRHALPLVNVRARSPPESRLRLVWLLDAHLPVPLVNPEVSERGRLLGLPHLLDAGTEIVAEYDGAQHRQLEEHTNDNIR